MEVAKDIYQKLNTIPKGVKVVAATKYVDALDMRKLFSIGIHHFGENRVDAFLKKYEELKDLPVHWNFIGHLQTNKAKAIVNKIEVLHSLDSLKLAALIEKERQTKLDCFIEINMNSEESKNGISLEECEDFLKKVSQYPKVHILGFMMMTKKESSKEEKLLQFSMLRRLLDTMNQKLGLAMQELSMGMSDDYLEAISAGTTVVRLGRMLWEPVN